MGAFTTRACIRFLATAGLLLGLHLAAQAQAPDAAMVVTLLGTGTPDPRVDRFGNSTLVQAGGKYLVFDAGRGASIRLVQAGIKPGLVTDVFLTHYHSDHTNGLPDLWLTGWLPTQGSRKTPLTVHGPVGVDKLVRGLRDAYQDDVDIRIADAKLPPLGAVLTPAQFTRPGVVYQQGGVRVEAFEVDHGEFIRPAFGYKVSYGNRAVVISGDTRKSANVIRAAKGADLLIHEVAAGADDIRDRPYVRVIMDHHTSAREAGEVFAASRPRLAVYTHLVLLADSKGVLPGADAVIAQTRETYGGPLEVGEDLMRITLADPLVVERFDAASAGYVPTRR